LNKIQINLKTLPLFQCSVSGLALNVQEKRIQQKSESKCWKKGLWGMFALLQSQICHGSGWWPKCPSAELWPDDLYKVTDAANEPDSKSAYGRRFIFSAPLLFLLCLFFYCFNCKFYFVYMYGSSLMYFNVYCIIWEK